MNYQGKLLNKKEYYIERDAIVFNFIVLDENNTLITDLSAYKFKAELTDGGYQLLKHDTNYTEGGNSQILVTAAKITVYVATDDTSNWEGDFIIEVKMTHKTNGNKFTIIKESLVFEIEELQF